MLIFYKDISLLKNTKKFWQTCVRISAELQDLQPDQHQDKNSTIQDQKQDHICKIKSKTNPRSMRFCFGHAFTHSGSNVSNVTERYGVDFQWKLQSHQFLKESTAHWHV